MRGGRIGAALHSPALWAQAHQQLALAGPVIDLDADLRSADPSLVGSLDVLVVEAVDAQGRGIAPLVVSLAVHMPQLAIIVYDQPERHRLEALRAALIPGIPIEYVVAPFEPLASTVQRALAGRLSSAAGHVILAHLIPLAPADLHTFLTLAALKAASGRGVAQLAQWSNSTARTIERRLDRAGWSTAHTVLQSFRALDALWLMDEYGMSARRVRHRHNLAHSSGITRLTRRWAAGITPHTLRERGGFNAALEAVMASVTVRNA